MNNQATQDPAVNSAAASAVGSTDTGAAAAAKTAGYVFAANYKRIEQLIIEREVWEQGVVRTSNEQLYALLAKCYSLFGEMCGKTVQAAALRSALEDVIGKKSYHFNKGTHTLTKIVKCVFGVDRRRVSAYSLVLREALFQKQTTEGIATFITNRGGVEEIRRSKSLTAKTPAEKAVLGKQAVGNRELAFVSSDKIAEKIDIANVGNDLVAIVTQQADGSLIVRELINSQAVLNAALACAYSANKAGVEKAAKDAVAANDDKAQLDRIKDAANS